MTLPVLQSPVAYQVFGTRLISDSPLVGRLLASAAVSLPDPAPRLSVSFACVDHPPRQVDWDQLGYRYASSLQTDAGEHAGYLYELEECLVLRYTESTDFYVWPDHIICHVLEPRHGDLVEIRLLGSVLAHWLEQHGLLALHASAVSLGEHAVAFLSGSHGGKSSLAATFVQAGYALLSDDILALQRRQNGTFEGLPSYPAMRLWPEEALHFLGSFEELPLVHPLLTKRLIVLDGLHVSSFCAQPRPLAAIFLPQRRAPGDDQQAVRVEPLGPATAVIELVRNSFAAPTLESLGWQPGRLQRFAEVVRQVPLYCLHYPSGLEHLPAVCEALLAELRIA